MGDTGRAEHLEGGIHMAQGQAVRLVRGNGLHQPAGIARHGPERVHKVSLGLIHLVDHTKILSAYGGRHKITIALPGQQRSNKHGLNFSKKKGQSANGRSNIAD
jgi:hypothetical protein